MRHKQTRTSEPHGWNPAWSKREIPELTEFEIGRPHMRMKNPIYAGNLEGITQALYDIYFVAAATAAPKLTLFAQPVGQTYNFGGVTAFGKTFDHTNLSQAGMLEAPNKHIIRAISCFVQGLASSSTTPLLSPIDCGLLLATYLQLNINRKPYQDMVIGRMPAGGGVFVQGTANVTAGAAVATMAATNGWPFRDNTYALAYGGIPLEQAQNFNAIIDPTASAGGAWTTQAAAGTNGVPGNGISLWVILDGTLFRAVQ